MNFRSFCIFTYIHVFLSNNKIVNTDLLVGFIEENSAKWLEPIKLQAFDRDIGLNSVIVYEIVGSDYLVDYFKIENNCVLNI